MVQYYRTFYFFVLNEEKLHCSAEENVDEGRVVDYFIIHVQSREII